MSKPYWPLRTIDEQTFNLMVEDKLFKDFMFKIAGQTLLKIANEKDKHDT